MLHLLSSILNPRWYHCGILLDLLIVTLENFVTTLSMLLLLILLLLTQITTIIYESFIYWSWMHYNATSYCCSSEKSKKTSFKIKILPCGDVRSLYTSVDLPIKCPVCGHKDDTNCHLGFFPEFIQPLNDILVEIKQLIYQRLSAEWTPFHQLYLTTRFGCCDYFTT